MVKQTNKDPYLRTVVSHISRQSRELLELRLNDFKDYLPIECEQQLT